MPAAIPTSLETILQAAKQKVLDDNLFTDTTCFLSVTPDLLEFPSSDAFLTISPGPQRVDEGIRIGGGREVVVMHGEMVTALWVRLILDQTPRADYWLTDSTLGALALNHSVINSLELYQTSGLYKGLELREISTYTRKVDGVGWGCVKNTFKIDWQLSLTPQGP